MHIIAHKANLQDTFNEKASTTDFFMSRWDQFGSTSKSSRRTDALNKYKKYLSASNFVGTVLAGQN